MKKNKGVIPALKDAVRAHRLLAAGTILCVAASVGASLLPPLLLARVIDRLTDGASLTFAAALSYFASLALEGALSSAQETLLVLFGQKMTRALRSEMSRKARRAARRDARLRRTPARSPRAFRATSTPWRRCLLRGSSAWRRTRAGSSRSSR